MQYYVQIICIINLPSFAQLLLEVYFQLYTQQRNAHRLHQAVALPTPNPRGCELQKYTICGVGCKFCGFGCNSCAPYLTLPSNKGVAGKPTPTTAKLRARHSRENAAIFAGWQSIIGIIGESGFPNTSKPLSISCLRTQLELSFSCCIFCFPISVPSYSRVSLIRRLV